MRAFEHAAALTLLVAAGSPPTAEAAGPASKLAFVVEQLEHLVALPFESTELIEPGPIAGGNDAPTISLAVLDNPPALARQLRTLIQPPYHTVRLRVTDGQARLGNYSVGSGQTVGANLLIVKGAADVYGRVAGNVVALDGDIRVHRGARVEGHAMSVGGRVRNLGGVVVGQSKTVAEEPVVRPPRSPIAQTLTHLAGVVGTFVTLGLLGFGLVVFGKPHLEVVSDTASHSVLRSFLVGLLSQVLIVPTFGMLVVGLVLSVVGVLLVPFVVAVYLLLVIASVLGGFLAVAHAMGETHTRRRMARGMAVSPNSFRYLSIGLGSIAAVWLAWVAFGWVPVAGVMILAAAGIATWLLATVGLGACVLSRAGIRPSFAGRYLPTEMLTDEYLWATPQQGVPAVKRPAKTA